MPEGAPAAAPARRYWPMVADPGSLTQVHALSVTVSCWLKVFLPARHLVVQDSIPTCGVHTWLP